MGVTYRYENNKKFTDKKGVSTTIKESIIDGDLGMSFKYLEKIGDKFYKIELKVVDGKYVVHEKKGDNESSSEVDEKGLLALVKKNKNLAFVANYMTTEKKKYSSKGGAKRKRSKKEIKEVQKEIKETFQEKI